MIDRESDFSCCASSCGTVPGVRRVSSDRGSPQSTAPWHEWSGASAPHTWCSQGIPRGAPRTARVHAEASFLRGTPLRAPRVLCRSDLRNAASASRSRSGEVEFDRATHSRPTAVEEYALIDLRNSKKITGFLCAHAVNVTQHNNLSLTAWEGVDARSDLSLSLLR